MSKKQTSLESFFATGKRINEETKEEPATAKKKKAVFTRQYQDSYLKYVFIATGDSRAPNALCLICDDRLGEYPEIATTALKTSICNIISL